jgi:hypothetical protein
MSEKWEEVYRAALLEPDERKLDARITSAIPVLQGHLLELDGSPEHVGEKQRIADALRTLEMIRRVELKLPA